MEAVLTNLQNRNNSLKSILVHEQLKNHAYPFNSFKREMSQLLNEYSKSGSIFKAASLLGLNRRMVMNWYVQGQKGNPQFRFFYLRINHINGRIKGERVIQSEGSHQTSARNYEISNLDGSWCYSTYVDGEKVAIISKDLDNLKDKVKSKNLPLS